MSIPALSPLTLLSLATDPSTGSVGDHYFNTATSATKVCTNATGPIWAAVGSGGVSLGSATPLVDGTAAVGTSSSASHEDHVHPKATPSIQTVTSSATVTPAQTDDQVVITAQAAGLTLANPAGSPVQGQKLIIRSKDNGTARAITFGSQYRAMGNTLPTTTVVGKTTYLGLIFNSTDTKWDLVALAQEA